MDSNLFAFVFIAGVIIILVLCYMLVSGNKTDAHHNDDSLMPAPGVGDYKMPAPKKEQALDAIARVANCLKSSAIAFLVAGMLLAVVGILISGTSLAAVLCGGSVSLAFVCWVFGANLH